MCLCYALNSFVLLVDCAKAPRWCSRPHRGSVHARRSRWSGHDGASRNGWQIVTASAAAARQAAGVCRSASHVQLRNVVVQRLAGLFMGWTKKQQRAARLVLCTLTVSHHGHEHGLRQWVAGDSTNWLQVLALVSESWWKRDLSNWRFEDCTCCVSSSS